MQPLVEWSCDTTFERRQQTMSEKIVQFNEEVIKGQIKERMCQVRVSKISIQLQRIQELRLDLCKLPPSRTMYQQQSACQGCDSACLGGRVGGSGRKLIHPFQRKCCPWPKPWTAFVYGLNPRNLVVSGIVWSCWADSNSTFWVFSGTFIYRFMPYCIVIATLSVI